MAEMERSAQVRPYSLQNLKNVSVTGWFSMILVILEASAIIVIQGIAFGTDAFAGNFELQVYSGCFIWCWIFLMYLIIDTILTENVIQMYAFNVVHGFYIGFGIYQVVQLPTAVFIASVLTLIVCAIIYLFLTKAIHKQYGWQFYKKLGADPRISVLVRNYQIFLVLMKATFLFTMLFLILQIFVLLGFQNYEAYLDIITPPIFVLCWFLIVFAIRKENKILMGIMTSLTMLGVIYFLYKIIIYHTGPQYVTGGKYENISTILLTINAAYCLFFYISTSTIEVIIFKNFGRGLAQHFTSKEENSFDQSQTNLRTQSSSPAMQVEVY